MWRGHAPLRMRLIFRAERCTHFVSSNPVVSPGFGDWNQPAWSLSLEVLGYLLFPLLAFGALRVVRKWQLIAVASLGLIGSYTVLTHFAFECEIAQIAIVRMLSCFITGVVVFRLWA